MSRSNQASAFRMDGKDRLDRVEVAGQVEVIAGAEDPLQRPVGDQQPVHPMVAGREHLGQAVRTLAFGGLGEELGGQGRDARAERGVADQVLHRHVA